MLLRWDDQEVHVNDAEELESRLESLAKSGSAPVLVSVAGSAGTLSLGWGIKAAGCCCLPTTIDPNRRFTVWEMVMPAAVKWSSPAVMPRSASFLGVWSTTV